MRPFFYTSVLCFLLSLLSYSQQENQRRLAVPSYVSPTAKEWNTWQSLGPQAVGMMILNLNNGDDTRLDAVVAAAVKHTQESGILVLAYVHTGYAQRDPAEIRAIIDADFENYHVDGVFLDETPTECNAAGKYASSNRSYYGTLSGHVRSKPGKHLTVLNPGTTPPDECWMKFADVLVTFEEPTLAKYEKDYVDRAWIHRYPPARFWHLVYSVPSVDEMQQVLEHARQRGAGWLYVTDDGADKNPWDTPATYLVAEAKNWTGIEPRISQAVPGPESATENFSPTARRVSIQWSGIKGARTQILLDLDQKASTGFHGFGTNLGADLMLELPGDGSVNLMRYVGSGEDWNWQAVDAHVKLTQPEAGTSRAEFDLAPLGSATTIKIQFRSLDKDWNVISASKVFNWNPY